MSTTTLQFELRQGGTLTDPDGNSVLLSDATGTYGARRTDTSATVVADGTAMVRQSAGVYTYDVTDPAAGLTYQWVAEYAVGGVTKRDTFTAYAYGAGLAGFWTTQAQVEQTYGVINTGEDANLSNTGAGTAAVWTQALADVDAWIDRLFRANGYPLVRPPVAAASLDYPVIEQNARALVRVQLYRARGWADTRGLGNTGGDVAGAFAKLERDAKAELTAIAEQGVDWSVSDPALDTETVGSISVIPTYSADDITDTDEYAEAV